MYVCMYVYIYIYIYMYVYKEVRDEGSSYCVRKALKARP